MSVRVMNAVFERYPNGGGEMLLALALADHASDDGTRVYPSIKALAEKTRQSERSVQYQLRAMEASGWLILVNSGNGGRSQNREYVISSDWLKGAEIAPPAKLTKGAKTAPFDGAEKGAKRSSKGAEIAPLNTQERVQSATQKGAIGDVKGAIHDTKGCNGLHPHITINEPLEPSKNRERMPAHASTTLPGVSDQLLADYLAVRKAKKAGPLTETAVAGLQREADAAGIPLADAVAACCEFGWQGFNAGWYAQRKAGGRVVAGRGAAAQQAETPYQRTMRERAAAYSPSVARRAPGSNPPTVDAENVTLR